MVNSERDARIKKSILIRSLNKAKPAQKKLKHALTMKDNSMKHEQMKPVLMVKKVNAKGKPTSIGCQTNNSNYLSFC